MIGRLVRAAVLGVVVVGMVGAAPAVATESPAPCQLPAFGPGAAYHPTITPSDFSPQVTNRWFPLKVGQTMVYSGVKDGKKALDIVVVTQRTRTVDGVVTRVVEDRLFLDDVLEERTSDYFAQDRCGAVWYFGEDTATLDEQGRVVSTDGTFHAGADGAQPGVYMTARPQLGRSFRQEWYAGQAEDVFKAVDASASVSVPYVSSRHALRTVETTRLEPEVIDQKYYVRDVGEVFEGSARGPVEKLELVMIIS